MNMRRTRPPARKPWSSHRHKEVCQPADLILDDKDAPPLTIPFPPSVAHTRGCRGHKIVAGNAHAKTPRNTSRPRHQLASAPCRRTLRGPRRQKTCRIQDLRHLGLFGATCAANLHAHQGISINSASRRGTTLNARWQTPVSSGDYVKKGHH